MRKPYNTEGHWAYYNNLGVDYIEFKSDEHSTITLSAYTLKLLDDRMEKMQKTIEELKTIVKTNQRELEELRIALTLRPDSQIVLEAKQDFETQQQINLNLNQNPI
jgi:hypothetical protein